MLTDKQRLRRLEDVVAVLAKEHEAEGRPSAEIMRLFALVIEAERQPLAEEIEKRYEA